MNWPAHPPTRCAARRADDSRIGGLAVDLGLSWPAQGTGVAWTPVRVQLAGATGLFTPPLGRSNPMLRQG